jgi:ferredoxin
MSELSIKVNKAKCISCGLCIDACKFGSIMMVGDYPSIKDDCRLCGACAERCPEGAITIKTSEKAEDISEYKGVLVFAEQRKGSVHPVAYELLGKGKELADELGEPLYAVILGDSVTGEAEKLAVRGADRVFVYDDPALADLRDDPYTEFLCRLVEEEKPSIFLVGSCSRRVQPTVATSWQQ